MMQGLDAAFVMPWLAAVCGLGVSFLIEGLMKPAGFTRRPWRAFAIHAGLWGVSYALLVLVLGRPWFALAAVSAFLLLLVMINNAKFKALAEPFTSQDFRYLTDAILHPRLYIPFLGWPKLLAAIAGGAGAIAVGFFGEGAPDDRLAIDGQLGAVLALLATSLALLGMAGTRRLDVSFEPEVDIRRLGLLASLWAYVWAGRQAPQAASPFVILPKPERAQPKLPHLLAVQSESFFDARRLFDGVRADVLTEFDRLKGDAASWGRLSVPAWGANTVRTEFSFLSGIDPRELGVHRFNPFRSVAAGWPVSTLAGWLKQLGYRTVCVHPYPVSFYQRQRVYPAMGFDEFVDIRAFEGAERFGPYVSDAEVAHRVAKILGVATEPLFVFVITMENHGPLHLERVDEADMAQLYTRRPPPGFDDLTVYLRHLRNADRMIGSLRSVLESLERPAGLCWFGDHVPILPEVYAQLESVSGQVDFVLWQSERAGPGVQRDLQAHELAMAWLHALKLRT